jgi:hypothetical protein
MLWQRSPLEVPDRSQSNYLPCNVLKCSAHLLGLVSTVYKNQKLVPSLETTCDEISTTD